MNRGKPALFCAILLLLSLSGIPPRDAVADPGAIDDGVPEGSFRPHRLPADAPVVKTTLEEFTEILEKHDEKLLKPFEGKWVELSGPVLNIDISINDDGQCQPQIQLVVLEDPTKPVGNSNRKRSLFCLTPAQTPWQTLDRGSKVKVRGVLASRGYLDHCQLTPLEGKGMEAFTADGLAAAFKANPAEFNQKHDSKFVAVTGKLRSNKLASERGSGAYEAVFEGTGDPVVLAVGDEKQFRHFKAGETVTVIAEWPIVTPEAKGPIELATATLCNMAGKMWFTPK